MGIRYRGKTKTLNSLANAAPFIPKRGNPPTRKKAAESSRWQEIISNFSAEGRLAI